MDFITETERLLRGTDWMYNYDAFYSLSLISCHGLGDWSPVFHCVGPGFIPGQSIWDLWWTKGHWDRLFSEYLGFPLSISLHQCSVLIFVYTLLLPNGQTGKAVSKIGQRWVHKYLHCRLYRVHKTAQMSSKLRYRTLVSYSCIRHAVSCCLSSFTAHTQNTVNDDPLNWLNWKPFCIQQFPHRDSNNFDWTVSRFSSAPSRKWRDDPFSPSPFQFVTVTQLIDAMQ